MTDDKAAWDHRRWLARQLLDEQNTHAEAYSIVAFSPAIADLHRVKRAPLPTLSEQTNGR